MHETLTLELSDLRQKLLSLANLPEHYISISELAKAEDASKSMDGYNVVKYLLAAGKWVLAAA